MIPKLSNSSRFVEYYKNLQKRIAAVNDADLQRQLTEGLLKIKDLVGFIDRAHEQMFISGQAPSDTKEFRESISKQRKILENKLVEFEKRRAVTPVPLPSEE